MLIEVLSLISCIITAVIVGSIWFIFLRKGGRNEE